MNIEDILPDPRKINAAIAQRLRELETLRALRKVLDKRRQREEAAERIRNAGKREKQNETA